jgi:hypothetical protein
MRMPLDISIDSTGSPFPILGFRIAGMSKQGANLGQRQFRRRHVTTGITLLQ